MLRAGLNHRLEPPRRRLERLVVDQELPPEEILNDERASELRPGVEALGSFRGDRGFGQRHARIGRDQKRRLHCRGWLQAHRVRSMAPPPPQRRQTHHDDHGPPTQPGARGPCSSRCERARRSERLRRVCQNACLRSHDESRRVRRRPAPLDDSFQLVGDVLTRRGASSAIAGDHAADDLGQPKRDIGEPQVSGLGTPLEHALHRLGVVRTEVRVRTCQGDVQGEPQPVDVCQDVLRLTAHGFRGKVAELALDGRGGAFSALWPRQPKIDEFDPAVAREHHVRRRDVSVNEPLRQLRGAKRMRGVERTGDFSADERHHRPRQPPALRHLTQRHAVEQLGGQKEHLIGSAEVDEPHHVAVGERSKRPCLAAKEQLAARVRSEFGADQLQRDLLHHAIDVSLRAIDGTHPALTERLEQLPSTNLTKRDGHSRCVYGALLLLLGCGSGCYDWAALSSDFTKDGGDGGAGRTPNPRLARIAPGTLVDLGRYECANRVAQTDCESIARVSRLHYDAVGHRVVIFGGGAGATARTDVDAFDLTTLQWNSLYPSLTCEETSAPGGLDDAGVFVRSGHPRARQTSNLSVVAVDDGGTHLWLLSSEDQPGPCHPYVAPAASVSSLALSGTTWEHSRFVHPWDFYGGAAFDELSGMIVVIGKGPQGGPGGLWAFDPKTRRLVGQARESSALPVVVYTPALVADPRSGRLYQFGRVTRAGSEVRVSVRIEVDRPRWDGARGVYVGDAGIPPPGGNNALAYDPIRRGIAGAIQPDTANGKAIWHFFDLATEVWSSSEVRVVSDENATFDGLEGLALAYDPVDDVFLLLGSGGAGLRTWAYRP